MFDTTLAGSGRINRTLGQVLGSYYQLTKPRIIVLLLITTAGGMWVAAKGQSFDPLLMVVTLVGGALASASANTINCWYDRDIDFDMERTRHRPLPSGRVSPRDALVFAGGLAIASFSLLATYANLLAALLAMSGIAVYVVIYTLWLKRTSTQNIVIGGAAGAIPPLVGWAAVTGSLDWGAWVLFAIVLLWTPPHFWALALMMRDEYALVKVPMMPVVVGDKATVQQMMIYTLLTVPATFLLVFPLHQLGWVYAVCAFVLGELFIRKNWYLLRDPEDRELARSLFKYSLYYLMVLCFAMGVDSMPFTHAIVSQVGAVLTTILHV